MKLEIATLPELEIEDERSLSHVAIYADLKRALIASRHPFAVPAQRGDVMSWDRAVFLNLTFYDPARPLDVLTDRRIAADVVAHVAWHVAAQRALAEEGGAPDRESALLAESVASAFDVYLVGRLIGHAPESSFLESQVPAMRDATEAAGLDERGFEAMIEHVAEDPEAAFEELRALIFDASGALLGAKGAIEAELALAELEGRKLYPLLHHYELSNWILAARSLPAGGARAATLHDALTQAGRGSLALLEREWLAPLLRGATLL